MKRQVWADDQVMAAVNEAFIPVTIDVGNSNASAVLSQYGVRITPTTIITDPKGNVLQLQQGGMSKTEFLDLLEKLDPATVQNL
jgi:thioredoxin-related protein